MRRRRLAGLCAAAAVAAALCPARPSLGESVQVAAHGFNVMMVLGTEPLRGYLVRPDQPGRRPAVIVLHGCAGIAAPDVAAADRLKSFGAAALALDSLAGFDACGNDANGALAEAYDSYLALDWLARQGFVDPDRIAVLGFGMGGGAVLDAIERGSVERIEKQRFRAAVAFDPQCRDRAGVMTAPTLILVGDDDLASECRDMVAGRDGRGAPVSLTVQPPAPRLDASPAARRDMGLHRVSDPNPTNEVWMRVRGFLHKAVEGGSGDAGPH